MVLFKKSGLGNVIVAKAAMLLMVDAESVFAACALVGKSAVDHIHFDETVLSAFESCAVHTHLVFHVQQRLCGLAVIVGRSGISGFDGHEHHLVPIGIGLFPGGIFLQACGLVVLKCHAGSFISFLLDGGYHSADVGEGVGVV